MKCNLILLVFSFLCFNQLSFAQLYEDGTDNLPLPATQGQSMDVQAADLDDDGDLDIVLANEFQANTILENNGSGTFTDITAGRLPARIQDSEDVAIADFDNDGDLDLVFCSEDDAGPPFNETNVHEYYLNDGSGSFSIAGFQLPDSKANAVITADINGDQRADLFFGNEGANFLLINNGSGEFINESGQRLPGLSKVTQDLALGDVDGDGDLDLFAGNENGNSLLINNGNGFFQDESSQRLPLGLNIETRKVAFGDVDGDDDLDVFLSNVQFIPGRNRQNRLLINNGSGFFSDATADALPVDNEDTLDGIFVDVESDGDLDLVICNVKLAFVGMTEVYLNDGQGKFQKATSEVFDKVYASNGLGLIAADLNGDGCEDLYVCDRNIGGASRDFLLLKNATVAVEERPDLEAAIKVFPNPGCEGLRVLLPATDLKPSFELLDSSGRSLGALAPLQQQGYQFSFDLSTLTSNRAAMYFLLIRLDQYRFTRKIVLSDCK